MCSVQQDDDMVQDNTYFHHFMGETTRKNVCLCKQKSIITHEMLNIYKLIFKCYVHEISH